MTFGSGAEYSDVARKTQGASATQQPEDSVLEQNIPLSGTCLVVDRSARQDVGAEDDIVSADFRAGRKLPPSQINFLVFG